MTHKLVKVLPVGYNVKKVKTALLWGYIISAAFSAIVYFSNLIVNYNNLFYYDEAGNRLLRTNVKMASFHLLRERAFDFFLIFVFMLLVFSIYNFIYHYIGSKSIFTMRRLPQKYELIKRCVTVPVIFIILSFVSVIVLNSVYFSIYEHVVPEVSKLSSEEMMWRF